MTTTPLPPLPKEFVCTNGLWAYYTSDQMQAYATQARADLEAENKRLREALDDIRVSTTDYDTMLKARAALKETP